LGKGGYLQGKAEEFTHRLTKGTEVYCEGRLSLGSWAGKDGEVKTGLSLAAWDVTPMGQIGKKKPRKPKPQAEEYDPVPFDDPIGF
jgi:single-stranded DNA-binding protein